MFARLRPYLFLFLALTVVYHANFRPVDSSDTLPGSLIPFSLVLDHTIVLDRFVPWLRGHVWYTPYVIHHTAGHYFSSYPIGGPLLVSPLYLPVAFFGLGGWDPGALVVFARIAEKFAAAAIAALSAVLLLLLLKRVTTTPWAWCLTLVYALATETWSISSQALWQHGPGELAIIGCFYCIERWQADRSRNIWLWLCGACTGAAFIIRPTNLALLPAVLLALLLAKGTVAQRVGIFARALAVPLMGGLLLLSYNLHVFHHLSGGYAMAVLQGSTLRGLAGIYLSPGRGLLIYTPVALFALGAFLPGASAARRQHNLVQAAAVFFIILESLVISQSIMWWGGYCWGPRMLTEVVPPLIVLMAIGVSALDRPWPRRAFAVLALYSLLIQAIGAFFYPNGHWDAELQGLDHAAGRLWNWGDNPIGRTVRGGFYWQPYVIVAAALTGGIPAAQLRMRELNVNPYEEAKPVDDQPARVPQTTRELP
jgi:hypothetical protein